jgi:hypothetical protein
MPLADLEKARKLFCEAGLSFPKIPESFAAQFKELDNWLFSTREISTSPYLLNYYVAEFDRTQIKDYVVLAHTGHGVNSYALQYYVVCANLGMFLHLGWGGVYAEPEADKAVIRESFSLADKILLAAETVGRFKNNGRMKIVACDFDDSHWSPPGNQLAKKESDSSKRPAEVLADALHWLTTSQI